MHSQERSGSGDGGSLFDLPAETAAQFASLASRRQTRPWRACSTQAAMPLTRCMA